MSIRTRCKVCLKLGQPQADCTSHKERKYEAVVWNGVKQVRKTMPTAALAKRWESDQLQAIRTGTYRKIAPITFKEMSEKWVAAQDADLEIQSLLGYKMLISTHLTPLLGARKLSTISTEDIGEVRKAANGRSRETRKKINRIMGSIFRLALMYKHVSEDPTVMPGFLRKRKAKVVREESDPVIWNPAQTQHFLNYARPVNKLYYKLAILCGLRPQENCALNDASIDSQRLKVKVAQAIRWTTGTEDREHNKGQRFLIKSLKSSAAYREIPITADFLQEIALHQLQRQANPHHLLFVTSLGTPFTPNVKSKEFQADCKEARKTMPDLPRITIYKLRHIFCSNLLALGYDLKTVQELMGHEDERLILNIYGHVQRNKKDYAPIATGLQAFTLGDPGSHFAHIYPESS